MIARIVISSSVHLSEGVRFDIAHPKIDTKILETYTFDQAVSRTIELLQEVKDNIIFTKSKI